MSTPLNTVAFTKGFEAQAKAEGITEAEERELVRMLSENPMAGDLIPGSGGCRKVRLARKGQGKSGGFRVVTFYAPPEMPVFVIAVLAKNARANFSAAEIKAMHTVAKTILGDTRSSA